MGCLCRRRSRPAQRRGGTWSRLFRPDDVANGLPFVAWWLAIELAGLAALPATLLLMRWLPDRGYGLAKTLGVVALSYLAWLAASFRLAAWSRETLALVLLLLLVGAAWLAWWRRETLLAYWREYRWLIVCNEVLFTGAFVLFALLRLYNPDLWHLFRGGEKPMEFSYLNAVVALDLFPALRPLACRWLPELLLLRIRDRRRPDKAHRRGSGRLVQRCRRGRVRADGRRVLHVRLQRGALAAAVGRHGAAGRRRRSARRVVRGRRGQSRCPQPVPREPGAGRWCVYRDPLARRGRGGQSAGRG